MQDFRGRVAVITGGASGMGRGTALALAREGAHVAVADLNETRGAETVAEIEALGAGALFVRCDVSEAVQIERLRDEVEGRFGRVDILMNNAGVLPAGAPEAVPLSEWERTWRINFLSAVAATQAFLPLLLAAGDGHIVNTASYAGLISYAPFTLAYSASKAALVNFSEGLAVYLRPRGLGVTCLCPGAVTTNLREQFRVYGEPPADIGVFCQKTAATRSPEEVGAMVVAAIRQRRFLLPTDEAILDQVRAHGADPEGFIDHIIQMIGPEGESPPAT